MDDFDYNFDFLGGDKSQPSTTQPTAEGAGMFDGMFDSMFGKDGYGLDAIKGFGSLANAWQGMQNLDLQQDIFGFKQDAFAKNYQAQKDAISGSLSDRYGATVGALGKARTDQLFGNLDAQRATHGVAPTAQPAAQPKSSGYRSLPNT